MSFELKWDAKPMTGKIFFTQEQFENYSLVYYDLLKDLNQVCLKFLEKNEVSSCTSNEHTIKDIVSPEKCNVMENKYVVQNEVKGIQAKNESEGNGPYPKSKFSSMAAMEQSTYLLLMKKYSDRILANPTDGERKEVQQLAELHAKVVTEQKEFNAYLKEASKTMKLKDYFYIHPEAQRYVTELIKEQLQYALTYPRHYSVEKIISLLPCGIVIKDQIFLTFTKNILKMGRIPRLVIPSAGMNCVIPLDYQRLCRRFPPFQNIQSGNWQNIHPTKQPVSRDSIAESLSEKYEVDIVMSSGTLEIFIDNIFPDLEHSWEVPVTVSIKRNASKLAHKCVFIDKPIPSANISVREKNLCYHKYAVKLQFSHFNPPKLRRAKAQVDSKTVDMEIAAKTEEKREMIDLGDDLFGETDGDLNAVDTFGVSIDKKSTSSLNETKDVHIELENAKPIADNKEKITPEVCLESPLSPPLICDQNTIVNNQSLSTVFSPEVVPIISKEKEKLSNSRSIKSTHVKQESKVEVKSSNEYEECKSDSERKPSMKSSSCDHDDSDSDKLVIDSENEMKTSKEDNKSESDTSPAVPSDSVPEQGNRRVTRSRARQLKQNSETKTFIKAEEKKDICHKEIKALYKKEVENPSKIEGAKSPVNNKETKSSSHNIDINSIKSVGAKSPLKKAEMKSPIKNTEFENSTVIDENKASNKSNIIKTPKSIKLSKSRMKSGSKTKKSKSQASNKSSAKFHIILQSETEEEVFSDDNDPEWFPPIDKKVRPLDFTSESSEDIPINILHKKKAAMQKLLGNKMNTITEPSNTEMDDIALGKRICLKQTTSDNEHASGDEPVTNKNVKNENLESHNITNCQRNSIGNPVNPKSEVKKENAEKSTLDHILYLQEKMLKSKGDQSSFDHISSQYTITDEKTAPTLGAGEIPSQYPQLEPSENVTYSLWRLGRMKLLLRTKVDCQQPPNGKQWILFPKLEYQTQHGLEITTPSELIRQWIALNTHPGSQVLKIRINALTSCLLMLEEITMPKLMIDSAKFQPDRAIQQLHNILESLNELSEGQYLLVHKSTDNVLTLYKVADVTKRGAFDMHTSINQRIVSLDEYPRESSPMRKDVPWLPIDSEVALPELIRQNRIPCTFPPKGMKRPRGSSGKKKSKSKSNLEA